MNVKVTLIPGDGIGPEVSKATVRLLEAAGAKIDWVEMAATAVVGRRRGETEMNPIVESIRKTHVALKGPITTPVGTGHRSINVALRKALDLYANLRPVTHLPGMKTPFETVDLVIVRENTEDLYSGLEHEVAPGVVESLKVITEYASKRIAHFAFDYARRMGRKKVTAIHKANIMKLSDGLFLHSIREVAKEYPEIELDDYIIDNCCMQLVMRPERFDVLLLENLYGDIVSDLCAGLVGGLGLVPGANIGAECSLFEAVHGSAPDIAGKHLANPTALMLSAILMLRYLDQNEAADRAERAIHKVYSEGKHLTRDVGGKATTDEYTTALVGEME